jgi:hypothetical protein
MKHADHRPEGQAAIRTDLGAIFISLELSRSTWLITSLSPGGGETMSKHSVRDGDVGGLLRRFSQLQENRIKGLLFSQGVSAYEPLHRNRRTCLEELQTGGGRPCPSV